MRLLFSVARAGIETGMMLACATPIAVFAMRHMPSRRWGLLARLALFLLLDKLVLRFPHAGGFQGHYWNWQGKLLEILLVFVIVVLIPEISLESIGASSRLRPHWLKPAIVVFLITLALPTTFFFLGAREQLTPEGWLFELILPGISEEMFFRGLVQSELNRVFGRPWRWFNAECGWGLIITAMLFAAAHVFSADRHLQLHLNMANGIGPFIGGLLGGWMRERAGSIWPGVVGHNLSNLVIPGLTLFS